MKYSPKKYDTAARLLYCALLIASIVCIMLNPTGIYKTIVSSIGLLLLALSIYLFVKYDGTAYEYILLERNGTFDFYINKITGRRGNYVVYYPLTDCVEVGEYKDNTQDELKLKRANCRFSKYVQNFISSKELYYLVFKNNGFFDIIIFEPSSEMIRLISEYAGKAPPRTLHNEDDGEDAQIIVEDLTDENQ